LGITGLKEKMKWAKRVTNLGTNMLEISKGAFALGVKDSSIKSSITPR